MHSRVTSIAAAVLLLSGCKFTKDESARNADSLASITADTSKPIATPSGFAQPEAVRYDPELDLYFVSNAGPGEFQAKDNNGYISQMSPDGQITKPKFIAGGTGGATLHSPRGMYIVGDTLWVADEDAVRGFNRKTGAPLATADFSAYKIGFLNDVAAGPDGEYVTDTGTETIYHIARGRVTVALQDKTLGGPNGITWDAANRRFIVVPYGGESVIRSWTPGGKTLTVIGKSSSNKFDGVEVLPGNLVLASSQGDSSLHLFSGSNGRPIIKTGGAPADIAVDTKRNRVAVPFVDRSVVEIWQLPAR
jgi:sugar lactone lactonase YvrE